MAQIDLRNFLESSGQLGDWQTDKDALQPHRITLTNTGDRITFRGPLFLRVTRHVQIPTSAGGLMVAPEFAHSYSVRVDPGTNWSYVVHSEDLVPDAAPAGSKAAITLEADAPLGSASSGTGSALVFPNYVASPGTSGGSTSATPWSNLMNWYQFTGQSWGYPYWSFAYPSSQNAGAQSYPSQPSDVPCDFGVSNIPSSGQFFPSSCDPCQPGPPWTLPPGTAPTLAIPPAAGGCVRPRFFNGMFITKVDMETLLRWTRVKQQMQNRAMGQGVVWGLKVDRDGHHIRVHPGYAVDCCGNDLVVTTPYCVDINTLLADPASKSALEGPEPHRMHLLLEYHECPEEPRPVHGDPCSPDVSSCEMSRMRETVRLRLVPPRDYEPAGPLKVFLDQIESILGEAPSSAPSSGEASAVSSEAAVPEVPFKVLIGLHHPSDDPLGDSTVNSYQHFFQQVAPNIDLNWHDIQPSTLSIEAEENLLGVEASYALHGGTSVSFGDSDIRIELTSNDGSTFIGGTIQNGEDNVVSIGGEGPTFSWQVPFGKLPWEESQSNIAGILYAVDTEYKIQDLRVKSQDQNGNVSVSTINALIQISGEGARTDLTFLNTNVSESYEEAWVESIVIKVTIPPVKMTTEAVEGVTRPCLSRPCSTNGAPLFPTSPPWLYGDPVNYWSGYAYGSGYDRSYLRGLWAAVIYQFLSWHFNNYRWNCVDVLSSESSDTLGLLDIFYNGADDDKRQRVLDALRQLLRDWCQESLYRGPQCTDDPHGVVIGCVEVSGGDISSIDQWDGRRYVVHYPLLAHWAKQIGIAAPDVLVSRAMTMICCLGELQPTGMDIWNHASSLDCYGYPYGYGYGYPYAAPYTAAPTEAKTAKSPSLDMRRERLAFSDFVAAAKRNLVNPPIARPDSRFVRYELADNPAIAFVAPDPQKVPTGLTPAPDRELALSSVRRYIEESSDEIPPLLEDVAIKLTTTALDIFPLRVQARSPLRDRLIDARILTAGSVLRLAPSEIYTQVAKSREPRAITELVNEIRKVARDFAHLVARSIAQFSRERDVVSADELASDENRTAFADMLAAGLKETDGLPNIPSVAIDFLLRSVLRRKSQGNA